MIDQERVQTGAVCFTIIFYTEEIDYEYVDMAIAMYVHHSRLLAINKSF